MTTIAQFEPAPAKPRRVVYPTRDGKPMAETDKHRRLMSYVLDALEVYYADRPDVYVSGNNFVFWEEGNPRARISPDGYVVFGVPQRELDSYMAWKEGGRLPAVILEFTSRKTQQEDTNTKLPLYEQVLKTPEYFLFDPTGDYLKPRLQGHRLVEGHYVRLELTGDRLHSEQLGLDLVQRGETLRLFDPARQEFLPTNREQALRADAEARRADQEARRADAEARRAEQEARRAEQEAAGKEAAEAEIARLRAELDAIRNREQEL